MRNGQSFNEPAMTREEVQYTATAHTAGGRDGSSRSDDGRLDVRRSPPGIPRTVGFLRLPVRLQPCMYALGAAMYIATPALAQTRTMELGGVRSLAADRDRNRHPLRHEMERSCVSGPKRVTARPCGSSTLRPRMKGREVRPNGRLEMMDDVMPLDGNAAAGRLTDLFAVEMTRATVVCNGCRREGALATLKFYGGAGVVLRCPTCDTVILRLLDTGSTLNLDMRGCTRLTVRALLNPALEPSAEAG